jgi:opacity protein-like surface antigen
MKKIIFLTIIFSLLVATKGYGQQGSYVSAQYEVSFGTGDLAEYISPASWRGFLMEYRAAVRSNLMLGIDVGWNVFYEKKARDTYSEGNASLTGIQYRYQNQVPLLVSADYLIKSDTPLKPFIGLGLGTMYSERSTEMNLYRIAETTWHFAVKGELGLLYELSYNSSMKFAAKYYNAFKTNTLDSQGYFSLSLGMAWDL